MYTSVLWSNNNIKKYISILKEFILKNFFFFLEITEATGPATLFSQSCPATNLFIVNGIFNKKKHYFNCFNVFQNIFLFL